MVGWHHWLNRREFEQAPGDGEGQGSLACYSPWDHTESDTTEQLNNNKPLNSKCRILSIIVISTKWKRKIIKTSTWNSST